MHSIIAEIFTFRLEGRERYLPRQNSKIWMQDRNRDFVISCSRRSVAIRSNNSENNIVRQLHVCLCRTSHKTPHRTPRKPHAGPHASPMQNPTQDPMQNPTQDPTQAPCKTPRRTPCRTPHKTPHRTPRKPHARPPRRTPCRTPHKTPHRTPRIEQSATNHHSHRDTACFQKLLNCTSRNVTNWFNF